MHRRQLRTACLNYGAIQHPGANRLVKLLKMPDAEAYFALSASTAVGVLEGGLGEFVEGICVGAGEGRGASQGVVDAWAELVFEHGEHRVADCRAEERAAVGAAPGAIERIAWVLDRGELERGADRLGVRAFEAEEGAKDPPVSGCHPRERACARATREAQQYGFGLIVEGVTEEHVTGSRAFEKCLMPSATGFPFRARGAVSNLDADHLGVEPEVTAERCRPVGVGGGILAQPVVHDHGAGHPSVAWRHEGEGGCERQRISAAGDPGDHTSPGGERERGNGVPRGSD